MTWLIKRLQEREDSEHEMTLNRVVLLSLVLGYLVIAGHLGDDRATLMLALTWKVFAGHYVMTALLFAHLLLNPAPSAGRICPVSKPNGLVCAAQPVYEGSTSVIRSGRT